MKPEKESTSDPDFESFIDDALKAKAESKAKRTAHREHVDPEYDDTPDTYHHHYISGGDLPIMLITVIGSGIVLAAIVISILIMLLKTI